MDEDDNIIVSFTQDVIFPEGFDSLTNYGRRLGMIESASDFFVISLELSESTNSTLYELEKDIQIYWSIEVVDLSKFKIKIRIEPPELVSADGLDPDLLKFRLLKPEAFQGLNNQKAAVILPG